MKFKARTNTAPASAPEPASKPRRRTRERERLDALDDERPKSLRAIARGEDRVPLRGPGDLDPGDLEEVHDVASVIVAKLREIRPHDPEEVEARAALGSPLFSPEVEATILAAISLGAYDWIACACAGISARTLQAWRSREEPPFVEFARKLEQARAQARVRAEVRVAQGRPDTWLQRGPGKDRPGEPGWSDPAVKVEHTGRVAHAHAHLHGGRVEVAHEVETVEPSRLALDELREFERLSSKLLGERSISDPIEVEEGGP